MARVFLGIGSNFRPEEHLSAALDSLLLQFKDLTLSPVFESEAVGGDAPAYLNLVCGIDTEQTPSELKAWIKLLEDKLGRQRPSQPPGTVSIDIDMLTYGKLCGQVEGTRLPRPEMTQAAHVLWPLAVLAPKEKHPQLQRSYKDLWLELGTDTSSIRPVDFVWHKRRISSAALN